jgi:hypothetical protein
VPTPGVTTLSAITLAAQQRCDQVNSGFLSASEWTNNVNASIQELYGLILQKFGNDYYVKLPPYTFVTDGSSDYFALPTDFLKLMGVEAVVTSAPNGIITLKQFMFSERNRYAYPYIQAYYGIEATRYRLLSSPQSSTNDQLWLKPRAPGGYTIQVWYVPRFTPLVNPSDTWDGFNGWDEYVVIDAALKAAIKEEQDVRELLVTKSAIVERLENEAENRNLADPQRVSNSTGAGGWYTYDGGGDDGGNW